MRASLAVFSSLVSAVVSAVMLIAVSRAAEPDEIAEIIVWQVATAFVLLIVELGIGRELTLIAAKGPRSEFTFVNRLHLAGCVTGGLVVPSILFLSGVDFVLALIIVYCVSERRVSIGLSLSIATGRIRVSALMLIAARLTGLGVLLTLLMWDLAPAPLAYVSVLAGVSLFLAVALSFVPRQPPESVDQRRSLVQIVSVSIHYWAASLMGQARTLDVAVVGYFVPAASAAAYALPARALQPLRLLGTSIANVAFPLAASGDLKRTQHLLRMAHAASVSSVIVLALFSPFVPRIIELVVGPEYEQATVPLLLLALGAALNTSGAVYSSILQASGLQRHITVLEAVLLMFQALSLLILVNIAGINGAALAIVATYCIQLIVVILLYRRGLQNAEMASRNSDIQTHRDAS